MRPYLMLILAWSAQLVGAQEFIVKGGQPNAEIIVAEEAPRMTVYAAQELQAIIRQISGAELPIGHSANPAIPVQIYVGESQATRELGITAANLPYDAYHYKTGDTWLALVGDDTDFVPKEPWGHQRSDSERVLTEWDAITGEAFGNPMTNLYKHHDARTGLWAMDGRGSINAVYAFLRDLGCRWYFPGELGTELPSLDSIALPDVDRTVHPDFGMRCIRQSYQEFFRAGEDEIKWQLRLGLNTGHELAGLGPFGHGINPVHSRPEAKAEHPEYFAIWGGERMDRASGKPCLSSPELLAANVRYLRHMFDTYDMAMLNVSPADGYTALCECERCAGKATPERGLDGRLSDYVWTYVNEVAKELYKSHPDKLLSGLAYTTYLQPPESIDQLSPNLAVMICRWRSNFHDRTTRKKYLALRAGWQEKLTSGQFFVWDYYLHCRRNGNWLGIPVYFPQLIQEDLRSLKGISFGEYTSARRNWPAWNLPWHALAANHLNIYVTAQLYWDADQDLEALLADYFQRFYGPAAEEMRAFVAYAEANWMNAAQDLAIMDRYLELITAAQAAAGEGIYGDRVGLLVTYMEPLAERRAQLAIGREGVPTMRIYRRGDQAFTLDGKLDDPFWDRMGGQTMRETQTGGEAAFPTSVAFAWRDDVLHIGIWCWEPDMENLAITTTEPEDPIIWRGDMLEVMIETQETSFYQLTVNPAGATMDLSRERGLETRWEANEEVAIHHGDNFWSAEIRLPLAGQGHKVLDALNGISGRPPTKTHPWYLNVCRQRARGDYMYRLALSPTGSPGFGKALTFGEVYVR